MASFSELREKYRNGELFKVSEIVLDKNERSIHEVVGLGANYLTVIDATGEISKKWITDVISAESLREDFEDMRRKRSSSNQVAFAGYKTKNFTQDIFELFKPLIKEHKKDKFQVLNLVRVTDELLSETSSLTLKNYIKVKTLIERSEKYLSKMNRLQEHSYINDLVDQVMMFELEEGLKVTSMDRDRAAKIIGDALGVTSTGTPEEVVDAAAQKMKSGRFTPEAWKIAGKMFNMASDVGIKWNKNIFAAPTLKAMEIK
jgi:hypothetical protein